ncbi:hypothetical protein MNBD_GAMMA06-1965 [hydrothermal vent metagenome]|uniref:Uncharacterized protein n=1 Tax=hydrothermal vent metagenome TaxID=652676 RepID=A0A3B0XAW8_9ZZZZ
MALYSIDKLINETRRLAAEFKRTTGTMLPVSGEIARYDVSHHLDLTLTNDYACGYDAIGNNAREGLRVQIKSRVIGDAVKSAHRLGQLNTNGNWDIVVLSLMDDEFEPLEMYQINRNEVIKALNSKSKKHNTISVAKFKIISELVWAKKYGVEKIFAYKTASK